MLPRKNRQEGWKEYCRSKNILSQSTRKSCTVLQLKVNEPIVLRTFRTKEF